MIETTIAMRYARALADLAGTANKVDLFGAQIEEISNLLKSSEDLRSVLQNRRLPYAGRLAVIDKIFARGNFDLTVMNFVKVLTRKGRVMLVTEIVEEYKKLADVLLGRLPMVVVSAVEMPASVYDDLAKHFGQKTGKIMVLKKKIDPAVLGGVRVELQGMMYDATIAKKLFDLKQGMLAA